MTMNKISIIDYAKMISENRGDDADAVLLLRLNNGESQISIIGLDEMLISHEAVVMATALQHLLDTDMNVAAKLGKALIGIKGGNRKETHRLNPDEIPFFKPDEQNAAQHPEDEDAGSNADKKSEKEALREVVDGLFDLIFGGEHDEDDD